MAISSASHSMPDLTTLKPRNYSLVDMNASNGGLARGALVSTTFTNVLNYSGQGYFAGLSFKAVNLLTHYIRVILDGTDILIGAGGLYLDDLVNVYGANDGNTLLTVGLFNGVPPASPAHNLGVSNGAFVWQCKQLIRFESTCVIQARRATGNGAFNGGLAVLIKD